MSCIDAELCFVEAQTAVVFIYFIFTCSAGAVAAAGVSCIDAELCFVETETARARARLVTGHLGSRTHHAGHCHWPVALRQREYSGDTRWIYRATDNGALMER